MLHYSGTTNLIFYPLFFVFQGPFLSLSNSNFWDILFYLQHILSKPRVHFQPWIKVHKDSQSETLIPDGIECRANGLGLLFAVALRIWNQFQFNVRVWQAVWIHGHQVTSFPHWRESRIIESAEREIFHYLRNPTFCLKTTLPIIQRVLSPVTKTSSFSPLIVRWILPLFSVWSWPQRLGTLVSHRRWTFMSQPHSTKMHKCEQHMHRCQKQSLDHKR